MLNRFLNGFLTGICYMIGFVIIAVLIVLTCVPIVLTFIYGNILWLLSYLLIIPIDFGIWNMFF